MELPISDAHGVRLVSFSRRSAVVQVDAETDALPTIALVVVVLTGRVLFGFHFSRRQWELPGGTLEIGESARDAAIRELTEETGIRVNHVALVARAGFVLRDESGLDADVFALELNEAPALIENDELNQFVWWDPGGERWDGLSPIDAEIARRCLALEPNDERVVW